MQQQQGGIMGLAFPIVLFVLIFYFLIFRPQKKKQQQHEKMIASIGRGDTVVSAGGFFGRVSEVLDDSYIIEIADGVKVRILKSSISIRREATDAKPRANRPKKKKRLAEKSGDAGAPEGASETDVREEGVTAEENEALLESAPESTDETNNVSEQTESGSNGTETK